MKKAAVLLAAGFEEIEALTVVDLLRRAGLTCDMVSVSDSDTVSGSHGIVVRADRDFSCTAFDAYDAVILPGGMPGTANLAADARVLKLLRDFAAAGKLTAAICAAPTVLSKAGLLEGKDAVCYPGMEPELSGVEAKNPEAPVAIDGSIITSRGLGTAIPFALALIEYLESPKLAESIAHSVVYRA